MEVNLLVRALVPLATATAPHLKEWGGKIVEMALKSVVGEGAKQGAEALGLLRTKVEAKPVARGALEALAQEDVSADDAAEAEKILASQLSKILDGQEELQKELFAKLEDVKVPKLHAGRDIRAGQIVQGGTAIRAGRDVFHIAGGVVQIYQAGEPAGLADLDTVRAAYLRWVMAQTSSLALGGVETALGDEGDRRLELDSIYTALRTTTLRVEQDREALEHQIASERDEPPLSALEQLDRHPRLVLLGDPGSGKSTFVAFVALCMAGEMLGHPEVGLNLLTAPLPENDGSDAKEPQPWDQGALVPVRVGLRDFAAREPSAAAALELWSFLEDELCAAKQEAFLPGLEAALRDGQALVLLDGLDEVPEASRQRERLCRSVDAFVRSYSQSRFLVTSRPYAYKDGTFRLQGFPQVVELAHFGDGQIRRFARSWNAQVAEIQGLLPSEAKERAARLEQAIFGNARLRELATRPLLLTLMASLHAFRGGSLPRDRETLYDRTFELLLDIWEQQQKRRDEPSLLEWIKVDRGDVARLLQRLAYDVHSQQNKLEGTADIPVERLVARLMDLSAKERGEDVNPRQLSNFLSQRSGILAERQDGVYTFPHRTFQEYLSARHLVDGGFDYDEIARDGQRDPSRWREVILLAAARMGKMAVWDLADALMFLEDSSEPLDAAWGLHLAGQALAETANLDQVSERNRRRLDEIRERLTALLIQPHLPAKERALAGASLAELGDPRFDSEYWFLPADDILGFLPVPGGKYTLGQRESTFELSPFWIARWPVTVAQFRMFVESTGFDLEDKRALAGAANCPVVYVSWNDAVAYCSWMSSQLQELPARSDEGFWQAVSSGFCVRLPCETQWEAAAGGGGVRKYPWGDDEPEAELASFDSQIGGASSVGVFPKGAGPFGVEDQAGNVWEWCSNITPLFDYRVGHVIRGGSWLSEPGSLRVVCRKGAKHRGSHLGFRVCLSSSKV